MAKISTSQRGAEVAAVKEFISQLFRDILPHERVMVSYATDAQVQARADGKRMNGGFFPVKYVPDDIDVDANCYVPISASKKSLNLKTGLERYWRGVDNFSRAYGFFIDDVGDGIGSKGKIALSDLETILPPTAVVETSPGNFQVWYFLSVPCDDIYVFKGFLDSFVFNVLKDRGGDVTIKDVQRVGRLPAGYNNKRRADGELKYPADFRVNLLYSDYDARYTLDDIAQAYGFAIRVRRPEPRDPDASQSNINARWLFVAQYVLDKMRMGEGRGGAVEMNMSGKYRIRCPWGEEHTNGDPYGAYFRGRIPSGEYEYVFGCGHDTCRKLGRKWGVFVDKIVIPAIVDDLEKAAADDWWSVPMK
ncbi:DNA-primase RepB domain-containing protein [Paraburkholderia caribensis]|uniref:DNA-primase RepB domain-containing protein n=1 Tax=Paraburkholderia caribensis TaxID=75105 RepID=UPI001CB62DAA|nr:DNA-primase RepB domain-containing protein [Paraburkholderia caribensis]CAG9250017.1 hypothetical protein PCAR4_260103 [Paraburkholderia caribensis]